MNILNKPLLKPWHNFPASHSETPSGKATAPCSLQPRDALTVCATPLFSPPSLQVQLRVVSLHAVLLHEHIETSRVERLIAQLQNDQLLKNPPIVVAADAYYLVLDGATRITALQSIGCCDVVVQLVEYDTPGLKLETWNHLLVDVPLDEFFATLHRWPDLRIEPMVWEQAERALAQRTSLGTLALNDGRVFALQTPCRTLAEQTRLLNQIVGAYAGRGEMYRVAHSDLERLRAEHTRASALVVFPRYRPDEIRHLALNGSKLPMGITRHIIPGRVLRINIPLAVLRAREPLAQKNAWLEMWLKTKMCERQVRFYQEPVFLFDE
jgi:hypothetical protein